MNRSDILNGNFIKLTEIFLEQEKIINNYDIAESRYVRIIKLFVTFDLNKEQKLNIIDNFNKCETNEEAVELYKKYVKDFNYEDI